MNIHLIQIEQLIKEPQIFRPPDNADYEYVGIAIEDQGAYYYWARGVSIKISEREYHFIIANPKLYYFSTALKLHFQIENALRQGWQYAQ
ncbi:hypothetical protein DPM17_03615 [Polynucleobacter paneuropaeus]|uniref:hypothetical protein n=1 Tax=Polynucleobacter paneuropaeus TaxID=2527775 RepID=UPI000DBF14DD|nr:hypothetical protein [Polynucleobacter paneuropaeus]AWW47817.1 hypothetical protein DPM17_03615 [Polynucleobacter paneuropaeus]